MRILEQLYADHKRAAQTARRGPPAVANPELESASIETDEDEPTASR